VTAFPMNYNPPFKTEHLRDATEDRSVNFVTTAGLRYEKDFLRTRGY